MKIIYILFALFSFSVQAAIPVPSFTSSRASCVAPCSVYFDATGTTDADTTDPFADLIYEWDFGDTTAGKWGYGANTTLDKNKARGPLAGHVFETPGTYTVTMKVRDGTSNPVQSTDTITVTDPETIFATTTACIANGAVLPEAGVGGCPAVATLFYNSSDWTAVAATAQAAGAKRILLKRGDSFSSNNHTSISNAGPGLLGAYGTGAKPIITAITNDSKVMIRLSAVSDWRIMDLELSGGVLTDITGISEVTSSSKITILRVDAKNITGLYSAVVNADEIAVVDSTRTLGQANGYCVFVSGASDKIMVMGNYFQPDVEPGHSIRMQGAPTVGFVINNNTIYSAGSAMTLRGTTSYGVVSDNKFIGTSSTELINLNPKNTASYEPQEYIIIERNMVIAGTGGIGLGIQASYTTVRNNIFDASAYATTPVNVINGGYVNAVGSPVPVGNKIYNNTIYRSVTGNFSAIKLSATASPVFVASPAGTGSTVMTISSVTSGNVAVGGTLSGGTLSGNPTITSYGTFTNAAGTGTVNLSTAQTWADLTSVTEVTTITDTTVKNNIAYAPNSTADGNGVGVAGTFMQDAGINTVGAAGTMGNSSDAQVKISPSFASATPSNPIDFAPSTSSYSYTAAGSAVLATGTQDFFKCRDKNGVVYRGAITPRANALCSN